MKMKYRLGVIGVGKMATAILSGIENSQIIDSEDIILYDTDSSKLNGFTAKKYNIASSSGEVAEYCSYLLLSVKPQVMNIVLDEIKSLFDASATAVMSIAAGISSQYIRSFLGSECRCACIMPNTPLMHGKGATAISFSDNFNITKQS